MRFQFHFEIIKTVFKITYITYKYRKVTCTIFCISYLLLTFSIVDKCVVVSNRVMEWLTIVWTLCGPWHPNEVKTFIIILLWGYERQWTKTNTIWVEMARVRLKWSCLFESRSLESVKIVFEILNMTCTCWMWHVLCFVYFKH